MSLSQLARTAAAAALAASASAASGGEIRGRVLVDDKPAAGVAVSVLPFENGFERARREARREGPPAALATATTKPDGSFAAIVTAPAGTSVRLAFSGGGTAPRELETILDAAGDDAGEVRLPRAAALAGRVTDERGGPVVGATVTLWPGGERVQAFFDGARARGVEQTATTKADGTFRFEAASAEGNRLRVEAPAFATLERQPVRAGAVARPLTLAVGQVLKGSVTLPDRKTKAKGALVRFEGRTQTTRWVETRADGSLQPLPELEKWNWQSAAIYSHGRDGKVHDNVRMWTYWCLEEGTLGVDPEMHKTNDGRMPPVIHVDTDAPLYSDVDGSLITDRLWGLYYKPDFNFGGVQGGSSPYKVNQDPDNVAVDPYGPDSPDFIVGDNFIHTWCSMLAHCQKRFEGKISLYKHKEKSGGLGCFTPDNFPVFDVFRENVYVIADSNHGYKMLGVGKLVAQEIIGEKSALLEPFRFARFEKGELHPTSHSPFPWS